MAIDDRTPIRTALATRRPLSATIDLAPSIKVAPSGVTAKSRELRSKSRIPSSCSGAAMRFDAAAGVMLIRSAVGRKLLSSASVTAVARADIHRTLSALQATQHLVRRASQCSQAKFIA